ncbi:MinD/ParA family protein [Sedimenticola sp.]|uniref:MinD/ParA family protein n=1 Tax=Sedimenticola sp. TaxID=1940285 RepID=UPI003D0F4231
MRTTKATIDDTFGETEGKKRRNCDAINRMVVIASGKGGVGKSTLSANLGVALGQMNQQVCLFDADTNLANINILFGITPQYTLHECVRGEKRLNEILLPVSERLQIVPAASGMADFLELEPSQQTRLLDGLRDIERQSDVILVDSAAGVGSGQLSFFLAAACPVLVITPEPTSLTDAFSFLKVARRYGLSGLVYVVVNMASDLHAARSAFKRFKQAVEQYLQLQVGYLGYVLQDQHVPASVRKQQPVMLTKPECLASRCIRVISERLIRLLQNQRSDAESFSDYLREMNQPFGIELSPEGVEEASVDSTAQNVDWQQQVLDRLRDLDKDEASAFIRRAVSEWTVTHQADEKDLLPETEPALSVAAAVGESKVTPSPARIEPVKPSRQHFEGPLAESPYYAAVQFADLLARIESG